MYSKLKLIIDIDGTLCPIKTKGDRYEDLIPHSEIIEKLRMYHKNGARITLFTSRNMNTYEGNIGLINANTAKILMIWLEKWDIPYDELIYGKPWPGHEGFYVDDRSVRPKEFLNHSLDELHELCDRDKL